ncbi:MAG: hypothetical protein N2511_06905, partial [Thermodesulfovibrionales bacterium]|nr:hypothetical protein [Thermodesulfovibrionales bacterium]
MNLEEIKRQIDAINTLRDAQISLLNEEYRLNKELMRSIENRKRYLDVTVSMTDLYDDLIFKEEMYKNKLKDLGENLKVIDRVYENNAKELKKLRDEYEELEKSQAQHTERYKEVTEKIKVLEKAIESNVNEIKIYKAKIDEIGTSMKSIRDLSGGLRSAFRQLHEAEIPDISKYKDINEYTNKRKELLREIYLTQQRMGLISKEELKVIEEQLDSSDFLFDSQYRYYTLIKKISKEDKEVLESLVKRAKESKNIKSIEQALYTRKFELTAERFRAIGGLISPRSTLKGRLEAARSIQDIGKELMSLSNIAKASGKGISILSTGIAGIGMAIKSLGLLGGLGLLIQGIVAVVKTVNEMDKFLKQFNKTFLKLYGPTVLMEDVGKSMKLFTDSIFNLQKQLKYGLTDEDIVNMFKGISEAGLSLQGILTRVSGGYGRIIEEAAKIHLEFGVAIEEAGSMLGEQMMDLRASLDDVVKGFKVLSY